MHRCARRRSTDEGSITLGWLTRLVIWLAIIGVMGFDSISVGASRLAVIDDADTAVQAASTVWQRTHDIVAAYNAAEAALPSKATEKVLSTGFTGYPDGTVRLTVRRTARTMLLRDLGSLAHYATSTVTESGRAVLS